MASTTLRGISALSLFGCLLTLPAYDVYAEDPSEPQSAGSEIAKPESTPSGVKGIAFYYAKRYNGRKTNSGARYNPAKLTAAHPDLPHGTRVRVVNVANKKEVVVTVNDRCRKRKTPVIDLSRAAARELGFLGKGTAKVLIIPLEEEAS